MQQFDQIKYSLGLGGMMGMAGVLYYGNYYVGPMLAPKVGYYWSYAIVNISIILLTIPFALVAGFVSHRRNKKAAKAEAAAAELSGTEQNGVANASAIVGSDEFTQSAEEATQYLKNSGLDVVSKDNFLKQIEDAENKEESSNASLLDFEHLDDNK